MKRWMTVCAVVAAIALIAVPVFAGGPSAPAGKSNTGHLYLVEKNPVDWTEVPGGAWGKMRYRLSGSNFDCVFNGHGLVPENDYTLIYYPDPWPANGLVCLGSDIADSDGNVHIAGGPSPDPDVDMPASYDLNLGPDGCPYDQCGAKIWLVLSGDVNCDGQLMVGWSPLDYLFERERITFEDTDI